MSFRLGLTGSIGMGKSTTAAMFAAHGIPVWDADSAVHRLYAAGGAAVGPMRAVFPAAIENGTVSRPALKAIIAADPTALDRIEGIVHPIVAADRAAFLAQTDAPIVLLDLPLLFEIGAESWLDAIIVVTIPPEVQRARVLARPGMTASQFESMLARQIPDAEKRARADFIVETVTMDGARAAVDGIVATIRRQIAEG